MDALPTQGAVFFYMHPHQIAVIVIVVSIQHTFLNQPHLLLPQRAVSSVDKDICSQYKANSFEVPSIPSPLVIILHIAYSLHFN